jgi:cytidyltransferase-like protein
MLYSIQSIRSECQKLHAEGKIIVLATGFFDLLHSEHEKFLQQAQSRGDYLIVAVESDRRARTVKGPDRPAEPQSVRCQKILDRGLADYVIALGEDFDHQAAYESLMTAVRPNIYAVSSHTDYLDNKQKLADKYGGQLEIVHEWNPATSTTQIIRENQV